MFIILAWLFGLFQIVETAPVDIPIPEMPPDPFLTPDWVPKPDTPYTYTGEGSQPTWDNVYKGAVGQFDAAVNAKYQPSQDGLWKWALNSDRTVLGTAIKAVSGFINQAVDLITSNVNALDTITGLQLQYLDRRAINLGGLVNRIVHEVNAILLLAIPSLQAQITKLGTDTPLEIQYAALSERAWTVENIFKPLYTELLKVQPAIDLAVAHERALRIADVDVHAQQVPALIATAIAPLALKVATLTTESENCTQPMCETMGPKTDLGKLLKALNAAEWLALLAEIAALRADGLDGLVHDIGTWAATVIGDLESTFFTGGKTFGEALAGLPTA